MSVLADRIGDDLKQAMRSRDDRRRSVLRLIRAGIKYAEVAKRGPIDEAGVLNVIAREVREHRDSLAEFQKANRTDLVSQTETELDILLAYLPQQLSAQEIAVAAREVIAQVGAQGPADKAKVMPVLMTQLRGKANGREINAVVTDLLASSA